MAVDLHIHSTVSDGTLTPQEIVAEALRLGLEAIAIADHDHVDAVAVAQQAAGDALSVLPAVEISSELGDVEVHILGYMLDCTNSALLEKLAEIRASRNGRAREMVSRLEALGVRVDYAAVERFAGQGSVGRPHVARALVACGAVSSQSEAFSRYLRRGRPAYVPRYKLRPQQAIALVRQAGGAAVLAHPGLCSDDTVVERVTAMGVDGLEAYHVSHTASDTARYLEMAEKQGLLVTGGSDSHGPDGSIAVGIASVPVPGSAATELARWAETHQGHTLAGG